MLLSVPSLALIVLRCMEHNDQLLLSWKFANYPELHYVP